jgi:Protein of unknown function (DUF1579)
MTRLCFFTSALTVLAFVSSSNLETQSLQDQRDVAAQAVPSTTADLGPMKEVLRQREGTWDVTTEIQASANSAKIVSKGTQTNRLGVGGVWLVSDFEGEIGGHPLNGHAITGFDPQKSKYEGVWVDSAGRHITLVEGTYDSSKKTFQTTSVENDTNGKANAVTGVQRFVDPNTEVLTLFSRGPDGQTSRSMTITYRRRL